MPKEKNGKTIKRIKINKKTVAIYFSNGERLDISEEAYTAYYLYPGKELTQQEIDKLNKITSSKKLYEYALNLLSRNHYSEWKMREKLYAKGGDKPDVDYVISKLKELDLLNDKAFIEDYLRYGEEKLWGKNKIKQELLNKGVFASEIEKINFPISVEKSKAINLIPSLENKYNKYSYQQKKNHIYSSLLSRGFDSDVANYALSKVSSKNEKDEINKLKKDYQKVLIKYQKKYSDRELKEHVIRSLLSKGYKYNDITKLVGGNDNDF